MKEDNKRTWSTILTRRWNAPPGNRSQHGRTNGWSDRSKDELGVRPEHIHGIEDLHLLPTLSKDDLRDQYPYGLMAAPLSDCVRIHSTSGTTGRRVVAFYTQHDVDLWEECCARALAADMGCLPAERAFTAVPTSWEA